MGLVNQLGQFSTGIASAAGPLRGLLGTKKEFVWLPEHTSAFENVKKLLVSPPVLGKFMIGAPTVLQTDASRLHGLGFALLQQQEGVWRLIQCGSRFLQDAETRYAMVELEALAIYWAIKKCRLYLAGLPEFTVITDHSPLRTIFNDQTLDAVENPKVQGYKAKLSDYIFKVEWRKGSDHAIPDALSRAPVGEPEESDQEDVRLRAASVTTTEIDLSLEDLRDKAKSDPNYCQLIDAICQDQIHNAQSGYPALFRKIADELSVEDGLVLRGQQVVVPPLCVKDVLHRLHAGHQGIEKTKRRARHTVFWPGYTAAITEIVSNCEECQLRRPSQQQESLEQDPLPSRPFEMVTADFFSYAGKEFLVYACRYSGYPLVAKYDSSPSATTLIRDLRRMFSLMGVPNVLRSDQGPQFRSELLQDFLRLWGVQWRPSSPHHHQSNGHAESMVKAVKAMLAKTGGKIDDPAFQEAMLEFRNTPREDGLSPAQRLFGRAQRTRLPAHWRAYDKVAKEAADKSDRIYIDKAARKKLRYDKFAKELPTLQLGDHVLVQDPVSLKWDRHATIVDQDRRRYRLRFPSGRVLFRNRRFLRKMKAQVQEGAGPVQDRADPVQDGSKQKCPNRSTKTKTKKSQEPKRQSKRVRKQPDRLSYA